MSFLQPVLLIFLFGVFISAIVYIGILKAFLLQRSRMLEQQLLSNTPVNKSV